MRGAVLCINLLTPCTLHVEVRAVKILYTSIIREYGEHLWYKNVHDGCLSQVLQLSCYMQK